MAYARNTSSSTIFDGFTLNPLPYPVLLILGVLSIFLGISWYFSYEEVVETAEVQLGWILFVIPVVLLILVQWLSSFDGLENIFYGSTADRMMRRMNRQPSGGSSPWGVAALIVLLLVMLQFQSSFLESWFV